MQPVDELMQRLEAMLRVKDLPLVEVREFQKLVFAAPEFQVMTDYAELTREKIIQQIVKGPEQALIAARVYVMQKQLSGPDASPLELLGIEQVLITWLRLLQVERLYNQNALVSGTTPATVIFWEQCLGNARRCHLAAMESLARVRRLGRSSPALQVNIAQSGSQQMNVQGEAPPNTTLK